MVTIKKTPNKEASWHGEFVCIYLLTFHLILSVFSLNNYIYK